MVDELRVGGFPKRGPAAVLSDFMIRGTKLGPSSGRKFFWLIDTHVIATVCLGLTASEMEFSGIILCVDASLPECLILRELLNLWCLPLS